MLLRCLLFQQISAGKFSRNPWCSLSLGCIADEMERLAAKNQDPGAIQIDRCNSKVAI